MQPKIKLIPVLITLKILYLDDIPGNDYVYLNINNITFLSFRYKPAKLKGIGNLASWALCSKHPAGKNAPLITINDYNDPDY